VLFGRNIQFSVMETKWWNSTLSPKISSCLGKEQLAKKKNRPTRYLWLIRNGQEQHINSSSNNNNKISIYH
jgi:hypothetical protein